MKVKKVPQRTCLGCKVVSSKKELIRIVKSVNDEVRIDLTGKQSGRGTYICRNMKCLELAMKGSILDRALNISVSSTLKEELKNDLEQLIDG